MYGKLVTKAWLVVFALVSSAGIAHAQDAALVKKGQEVYAAQKCSVCHSIAGKGSKTNPLDGVGAKLSAADIQPVDHRSRPSHGEGQVHEEAADASEVRQAAGGRPRRARRLHAKPQVSRQRG